MNSNLVISLGKDDIKDNCCIYHMNTNTRYLCVLCESNAIVLSSKAIKELTSVSICRPIDYIVSMHVLMLQFAYSYCRNFH